VLFSSSTDTSSPASILFSKSSILLVSSFSFVMSSLVFSSAAMTSSTADRLLAFASCSTRITSQFSGTGISRAAMWRTIVVLPWPFGPRMP